MNYIKTALKRGLLGIPLGVFINQTIFILIIIFYNTLPAIANMTKHQIILQYVLSSILGFIYTACTVIFEIDEWSHLKQTIVHFIFTSIVFYFVAIWGGWLPKDIKSIILFSIIFLTIYIVTWLSFKIYWNNKIEDINNRLRNQDK